LEAGIIIINSIAQMEYLLFMIYGKINTIQMKKLHIFAALCEAKENIGA